MAKNLKHVEASSGNVGSRHNGGGGGLNRENPENSSFKKNQNYFVIKAENRLEISSGRVVLGLFKSWSPEV